MYPCTSAGLNTRKRPVCPRLSLRQDSEKATEICGTRTGRSWMGAPNGGVRWGYGETKTPVVPSSTKSQKTSRLSPIPRQGQMGWSRGRPPALYPESRRIPSTKKWLGYRGGHRLLGSVGRIPLRACYLIVHTRATLRLFAGFA